ncbi:MAG: bile acid:sodium symporter family protein [Rhodospirillales bacterium]|nr:bile acid:sodium symporter family protein [Rhodospirillales bacterium]
MGIVTTVILPLALAFIMFTLGLGLTIADFVRVASQPKDFIVGLISQVILLPLVGFILLNIWPVTPEIALGVMIIAAAPGGVTSNILTSFAKGDVALSISLTAIISLLSVLTIPFIVVFSYGYFVGEGTTGEVSITKTAVSVFLIVTVPVIIGLMVRKYAENFAIRFEVIGQKISAALFALVLLGAIVQERNNIIEFYAQAGGVTLALNVIMLVLAWYIAKMFGSGAKQRIAISIECGLQNGTLAIAVATLLFGGGTTVIPAAVYSLTMFGTALIFIWWLRRGVN